MSGAKIIEGLKAALAGNFSSVFIEGQHWVRLDWQPIETAPKDGTVVLVCGFGPSGYYVTTAQWDGAWFLFDVAEDRYSAESSGHSHWMPLPKPPGGQI